MSRCVDRRAVFFLAGALLSVVLLLLCPPEWGSVRWILGGVFVVLGTVAWLDHRSPRSRYFG